MMTKYPVTLIRSKSDFSKRISDKKFSQSQSLNLINHCLENFDNLWRHSKKSEVIKGKYVRDAKGTDLGLLLARIDQKILAKYDKFLPNFIFGGIAGRNNRSAASYLQGSQRERTYIFLDIARFFEQIDSEKIEELFTQKFKCTKRVARIFSKLCCVADGPKGSTSIRRSLARGFATSSRLAVWQSLSSFSRINRLINSKLKDYDPRLAVYIDDVGISASRVPEDLMEMIRDQVVSLLSNDGLSISKEKAARIVRYDENPEFLGLRLNRNRLSLGKKTLARFNSVKRKIKNKISLSKKKILSRSKRGHINYCRSLNKKSEPK